MTPQQRFLDLGSSFMKLATSIYENFRILPDLKKLTIAPLLLDVQERQRQFWNLQEKAVLMRGVAKLWHKNNH